MFNRLNNKIQKYFGISRTEVNGLMLLFPIMCLIMLSPIYYQRFGLEPYSAFVRDSVYLDSLVRILESENKNVSREGNISMRVNQRFPFDPNTTGYEELLILGFDTVVAKRLIKYRSKGGSFATPDDLLRIYGLSGEFFSKIEPFIDLPDLTGYGPDHKPGAGHFKKVRPDRHSITGTMTDSHFAADTLPESLLAADSRQDSLLAIHSRPDSHFTADTREGGLKDDKISACSIDINQADSVQLRKIRGIGPVYSGRIIRYRELLGGYVHKDQLDEVYGLTEETLALLKKSVRIDTLFEPEKIEINFAEWADLVRHPYIYSDLANKILDARSKYGPFRTDADIEKTDLVSDSIFSRIKPYISY